MADELEKEIGDAIARLGQAQERLNIAWANRIGHTEELSAALAEYNGLGWRLADLMNRRHKAS